MAGFEVLLAGLRRAEKQFEKQLGNVRDAIAALQGTGKALTGKGRPKRRRKMSAETKAKMAAAQQKRWAAKRAKDKK